MSSSWRWLWRSACCGSPLAPSPGQALPATPPLIEEVSRLVSEHFYDRGTIERVWAEARAAHTAARRLMRRARRSGQRSTLCSTSSAPRIPSTTRLASPLTTSCSTSSPATSSPRACKSSSPKGRWLRQELAWCRVRLRGGGSLLPSTMAARRSAQACWSVTRSSPPRRPFYPIGSFDTKAGETVRLEVRRVDAGPTFPMEVVPQRIRPNEFFLSAMRASVRVIEHEIGVGATFGSGPMHDASTTFPRGGTGRGTLERRRRTFA